MKYHTYLLKVSRKNVISPSKNLYSVDNGWYVLDRPQILSGERNKLLLLNQTGFQIIINIFKNIIFWQVLVLLKLAKNQLTSSYT